jgi:chromosome segregation ATPase
MAPMKRKAAASRRAAKRSRNSNVPTVVHALERSDAVPTNLRSLLKATLPVVLNANKVDRHAFEVEIVDQAQSALAAVQASLEQAHATALTKQNEIIAPAERAKRSSAKQEAEAHLEAMKAKLEADKAAQKAQQKAVEEAQDALKAAQKEDKAAEKELRRHVDKKATLSNTLAHEFVMLKEGTSTSAEGKKAVQKLLALGKEYGLDSTLLHTFPITCKKPVASRTEFETMTFSSLQALIDRVIDGLAQQVAEAEPVKAAKLAAMTSAQEALDGAKAAFKAADTELAATQTAKQEATKNVAKADSVLRKLWEDMRAVCEAQDGLTNDLQGFKDNVLAAFQAAKEKEPEPEPVAEPEPVEAVEAVEPAESTEAAPPA